MDKICFKDMVTTLNKPGSDIMDSLTASKTQLLHMGVGVMGEMVELMEAFQNEDVENIIEEMGDVEFFLEGVVQTSQTIIVEQPYDVLRVARAANPFFVALTCAGELLDAVKKYVIYNDDSKLQLVREKAQKFRTHFSDLYIYYQFSREKAIDGNIAKLGERYNGYKYSDQAAKDRADKK